MTALLYKVVMAGAAVLLFLSGAALFLVLLCAFQQGGR